MANIKFSAFNTETNSANVDFLVGYQGTTMKKIAPSNLGGSYPFLIDTDSLYSGFVPSGLSGNPQDNTILGIRAGNSLTSGDSNTLIGNNAGDSITTGTNSVAVGMDALAGTSTVGNNVAVGKNAYKVGTAANNVYVGYDAGSAANTGSYQIGIGISSGNSNTGSNSIGIGWFANRNNSASGTISIGHQAGYSQTSGIRNTNLGYQAGYSNTTGGDNVNIGYEAGKLLTGGNSVNIGYLANSTNTTSGDNTVVGYLAMQNGTGTNNVAIGGQALRGTGFKNFNTALGVSAGSSALAGSNNLLLGYNAQASSGSVSNEITLGNASVTSFRIPGIQSGASNGDVLTFNSSAGKLELQAAGGGGATDLNGLSDCLVTSTSIYLAVVPPSLSGTPNGNVAIGIDAGLDLTSGYYNTLIGQEAGFNLTTGNSNVALGFRSLRTEDTGSRNVAIGHQALYAQNATTTNTYNNALGYNAGRQITTGSQNVLLGGDTGDSLLTGSRNVFVGHQAGKIVNNAVTDLIAIGYQAANNAASGSNVHIGRESGRSNTGNGFIGVGLKSSYTNTSGQYNTTIGYFAAYTNATGSRNTVLGTEAAYNNIGSDGVFVGYQAGYTAASSLNRNVMVGAYAGRDVGSTRFGNTFIGYETGRYYNSNKNTFLGSGTGRGNGSTIPTGFGNTALGSDVFENSTTAGRFIAIGYQCLKNGVNTGDRITAIGCDIHVSDTLTGSDNIIIGSSGSLSAVGVSNEVNLYNGSVVARFQGAASAWSFVSDERDKKDIEDLELGLDFVNKLKPRKFKWDIRGKEENKNKEASGFIAQEIKQTLEEVGASYTGIVDDNNPEQLTLAQANIIPMLVKSIQELKAEVEILKSQNN